MTKANSQALGEFSLIASVPIRRGIQQVALYQGGLLSFQECIPSGVLVSCAKEINPDGFPERCVYWAKLDDGPADTETITQAKEAAAFVLEKLEAGNDCLVFCAEGLNRSGLVNALVLRDAFGVTSRQAIKHLRAHRHRTVLKNWAFEHYLLSLDKI